MSVTGHRFAGRPIVKGFFEKRTNSIQYVVADPGDEALRHHRPGAGLRPEVGRHGDAFGRRTAGVHRARGLHLEWILDTHPHADHFSAAGYLKDRTGVPTAIGEKVVEVQKLWKGIYNLPDGFPTDGSQWDRLFADGERFTIGNMDVEVMFTPGHTLASIAYVVGDAAFIHDTIFMPDGGTARADFPGGSAHALWKSIQRIMALPDETRLFTGHDYMPGGREPRWESTVAEQRANEHAPHEGEDRGGVRGPARGARPRAADAEADPAFPAGEYPRRAPARARGQRKTLPEDPARRARGRAVGRVIRR